MLDSRGHVKLIDFGLVYHMKNGPDLVEGSLGEPMSPTGSLIYMAPELLQHRLGGRHTDWWAVGVLAHELLTGRTPWSSLTNKKVIQKEISGMRVAPPAGISPAAGMFICSLLHQVTLYTHSHTCIGMFTLLSSSRCLAFCTQINSFYSYVIYLKLESICETWHKYIGAHSFLLLSHRLEGG
jgi:hypothetical protein